jgi:hypothetical protein
LGGDWIGMREGGYGGLETEALYCWVDEVGEAESWRRSRRRRRRRKRRRKVERTATSFLELALTKCIDWLCCMPLAHQL